MLILDEQNKNKDKEFKNKNKFCSSIEASLDVSNENKSHVEEITNSLTEKILDQYNEKNELKHGEGTNDLQKLAINSMEIESATNEEGKNKQFSSIHFFKKKNTLVLDPLLFYYSFDSN